MRGVVRQGLKGEKVRGRRQEREGGGADEEVSVLVKKVRLDLLAGERKFTRRADYFVRVCSWKDVFERLMVS